MLAGCSLFCTLSSRGMALDPAPYTIASLIIRLTRQIIGQDAHGLEGHELPILDKQILNPKNIDTVFRAKRSVDSQGWWTTGMAEIFTRYGIGSQVSSAISTDISIGT